MHKSNRLFWNYCSKKYPSYFNGPNEVLEVGSCNVNGSVREHFINFKEYVGVDWRAGPGVDVVCLAEDINFNRQFDVVVSCSMLEHDPHWDKSVQNMLNHLKESGILLLSWGAAFNPPHCEETAIDGEFHGLPAGYVINLIQQKGIYVHEFRYEGRLPFVKQRHCIKSKAGPGMGEVCLVGFKDKKYAIGDSINDILLSEDDK